MLTQLWDAQRGGNVTHDAYEAIGELTGAISSHAESVYAALSPAEQETTRRVFLQLVQCPVGAEATRRRTPLAEIGDVSLPVVRKLADVHLVVTGRDETTGGEYVEIVHEAPISGWSRLQAWIGSDREFLAWRERLRTLVAIAAVARHQKHVLLRGTLRDEARDWVRRRKGDLSSSERTFIQRSITEQRQLVLRIVVLAGFVVLAVMYASYLVMAQRAEQVLAARPHSSSPIRLAPEPEQSEMSMPLRVWIPERRAVPTTGFARLLHADATARGVKWVSDPDTAPPTHIFRLGSRGWAILENGNVIDSGPDAHELLRVLPPGSSLFVEFPPPASLLHEAELRDVEVTSERETADYALVGRYSLERHGVRLGTDRAER